MLKIEAIAGRQCVADETFSMRKFLQFAAMELRGGRAVMARGKLGETVANSRQRSVEMPSAQVITSPLLRQFATVIEDGVIEVSTKLGPSMVSRSTFAVVEFPAKAQEQKEFLLGLLQHDNPAALPILKSRIEDCVADQVKAVQKVIATQSA